jgi:hypothetical protein
LIAPARTPGILDDEAIDSIADHRKGVTADVVRLVRRRYRGGLDRFAIVLDPIPAIVNIGGNVDRVCLEDGRLHIDDRLAVDSIIRAKRRRGRTLVPSWAGGAGSVAFFEVGPERLGADSVLVEPFHGAAAARAFVVLPLPFIVEPSILVEHPRADAFGRLTRVATLFSQQVGKLPA